MKNICITYCILAIFLGSIVHAEDKSPSPSRYENALLEMTNEARRNPLAMAKSLGMDTAKMANDLPELADILKNGLPPLAFHPKLYQSASFHAKDMLNKKYYSAISPDKKIVQERILETGYIPVIAGESLGMLSFGNFMEPDKAATAIFHNMFMDELNPSRSEKRNILNPDIRDAGISFQGGGFEFQGGHENVYVVVCDFGNNDTSLVESALLKLINDARKNPRQALEKFGITDDAIKSSFYSWMSDYELPPLTNNDKLREAACNHNQDMIRRFYFDNITPEGKKPLDRISDAGYYHTTYVNETLLSGGFEHFIGPSEAVLAFYEQLIGNESDHPKTRKGILDAEAKDIGMNFDGIILNMGNGIQMKVYVLTIDIATDTGVFSGGVSQSFDKKYISLDKQTADRRIYP